MNKDLELIGLTQGKDTGKVRAMFDACRDYVELETGHPPTNETVTEFFEDHPPTISRSATLSLIVVDQRGVPVGLVEILRGYPDPMDWYIGFLGIDRERRGEGFGKRALDRIVEKARGARMERLLLCVLEENLRAQAFWHREGFELRKRTPPWTAGSKTHIRHELVRQL
ncbi:GNAT family N-acetyltransferase [Pacificoceanicola onchidii]|uniref:GNAT family N-acetyltransferase n=1 Tax=Pacificoceanicola onchidii TaxID=2562685 RepID=UPI0010A5DDF0|nr:GNAT family N-acetyltransferase [Pacificoceanicola onchidii]